MIYFAEYGLIYDAVGETFFATAAFFSTSLFAVILPTFIGLFCVVSTCDTPKPQKTVLYYDVLP